MEANKYIQQVLESHEIATEKFWVRMDSELIAVYKQSLRDVRIEIARMYDKYGEGVSLVQMQQRGRLESLEKQILEILRDMTSKSQGGIAETIKQTYAQTYYNTGFAFESAFGLSAEFQRLDAEAIKRALDSPVDVIGWDARIKGHSAELNKRIQQSLAKGLIQGSGYTKTAREFRKQMRQEIGNYFESYAGQSLAIVRTESNRARSAARLLGLDKTEATAKRVGLKSERVWIPTRDGRTRDSHNGMAGEIADKEGYFTFPSGAKTKGPGLSGIASEDINCRCTVRVRYPDLPAQYRDTDGKLKDFGGWGKAHKIKVGYEV